MSKLQKIFFLLLTALFITNSAFALDRDAIESRIKKQFPDIEIRDIRASQIPGLFEVVAGYQLLYTSEDGRFLMQAEVIDLNAEGKNITEYARRDLRSTALAKLNEKDMVIFPAENPKHTLTIFTDIDCGYCRKLHSEMRQLNSKGITVRYLAFPRTGLNSASYDKAVSVWCADDKQDAMTNAKLGKEIPKKTCDNPVADQFNLGVNFGVSGTPTLIFEDGSVYPGYMPAEQLKQEIESH